jgi:hypothetical protein
MNHRRQTFYIVHVVRSIINVGYMQFFGEFSLIFDSYRHDNGTCVWCCRSGWIIVQAREEL